MVNFFSVYAFSHLFSQGFCSTILDVKESTEPLNIEFILPQTKFLSVKMFLQKIIEDENPPHVRILKSILINNLHS
jgi:hypothetical protein